MSDLAGTIARGKAKKRISQAQPPKGKAEVDAFNRGIRAAKSGMTSPFNPTSRSGKLFKQGNVYGGQCGKNGGR